MKKFTGVLFALAFMGTFFLGCPAADSVLDIKIPNWEVSEKLTAEVETAVADIITADLEVTVEVRKNTANITVKGTAPAAKVGTPSPYGELIVDGTPIFGEYLNNTSFIAVDLNSLLFSADLWGDDPVPSAVKLTIEGTAVDAQKLSPAGKYTFASYTSTTKWG